MNRPTALVLGALSALLVLLPLGLKKPGLPMGLQGTEATTLLMTLSLARDGDLRCAAEDVTRLLTAFPFAAAPTVTLMAGEGGSPRFAAPLPYALAAAPVAALFGANGLPALNMLLLMLAIALGTRHLARYNPPGLALLFTAGFFLLSAAFAYAFHLEAGVFVLAMVTVALALSWNPPTRPWRATAGSLVAGMALAAACFHQPLLALFAPIMLLPQLRARTWRSAALWCAGLVAAIVLFAVLGLAWTGTATPGLGPQPAPVNLTTPGPPPPPPDAAAPAPALRSPWLFLLGRHVGFLPYFPFVLPALLFFFAHGREAARRWGLLATLMVLAAAFLLLRPTSWHGSGLQVANPAMLPACGAFLFLVTRITPAWSVLGGYLLGGLFLGPLLFTPFGAPVPGSTEQAHTRSPLLRSLPLELPLLGFLPDYQALSLPEGTLWARRDAATVEGEGVAVPGPASTELWLTRDTPLTNAVLGLESWAPHNEISLHLANAKASYEVESAAGPARQQVTLTPTAPTQRWHDEEGEHYAYRLVVSTSAGASPAWRERSGEHMGVGLTYLGTREHLDTDLYALTWLGCGAPAVVETEERFQAVARLRNDSPHPWPHRGAARVRLAYHWLHEDGSTALYDGARSDLEAPLQGGAALDRWQEIKAPAKPGRYILELDPIFENVAWFSARNGGKTCRAAISVRPAPKAHP